jgi:hypothetical protein
MPAAPPKVVPPADAAALPSASSPWRTRVAGLMRPVWFKPLASLAGARTGREPEPIQSLPQLASTGPEAEPAGLVLVAAYQASSPAEVGPEKTSRGSALVRPRGGSSLILRICDLSDPCPAGSDVHYVIQVTNPEPIPAYGLRVRVECAQGIRPLEVVNVPAATLGPREVQVPEFDLAPFGTRLLRLRLRAEQATDVWVRVTVSGEDLSAPLVQEETTRIYRSR